jgi:hypothetical protein
VWRGGHRTPCLECVLFGSVSLPLAVVAVFYLSTTATYTALTSGPGSPRASTPSVANFISFLFLLHIQPSPRLQPWTPAAPSGNGDAHHAAPWPTGQLVWCFAHTAWMPGTASWRTCCAVRAPMPCSWHGDRRCVGMVIGSLMRSLRARVAVCSGPSTAASLPADHWRVGSPRPGSDCALRSEPHVRTPPMQPTARRFCPAAWLFRHHVQRFCRTGGSQQQLWCWASF